MLWPQDATLDIGGALGVAKSAEPPDLQSASIYREGRGSGGAGRETRRVKAKTAPPTRERKRDEMFVRSR